MYGSLIGFPRCAVECASCGKKAKNARLPVGARNVTKNREADIESAADNDPDHVRGFLMLNVELHDTF